MTDRELVERYKMALEAIVQTKSTSPSSYVDCAWQMYNIAQKALKVPE